MNFAAFFVSGFLLALLGAALPAWGYHAADQYSSAGWLFFALSIGILAANQLPRRALPRASTRAYSLTGCAVATLTLLLFGILPPPVRFAMQLVGWFAMGFSAGLLHPALFESITASYGENPARAAGRAGILFVLGCLTAASAIAGAFRFGFVSQTPAALALVPAAYAILCLRRPSPALVPRTDQSLRLALREFSKPGAFLFTLLVIFQSGSEWTVAGWLPVFLTHRIGISPEDAVWMLALFWGVMLGGRALNGFLLARIRHGRFVFGGAASALVGCILLVFSANALGAIIAVVFLGSGFAGVYPFLAHKMGTRFPDYHAGLFAGIFSFALSGGLLSAWLAGLLAESWGLTAIVALPGIATFLVMALLLVLWLESKVTGR